MSLRTFKLILLALTVVALGVIGPYLPPKWATTVTFAQLFAIYSIGWDFLSGMTGQISFGHIFFVGVSGYTAGLLNMYLKWPLWATIPTGMVLAMLMGLLFSVPALRLKGPYFSLVTLILPLAAARLVIILGDWTGGELGKFGATPLCPIQQFVFDFRMNQLCNYYIIWGVLALMALGLIWLASTRIGKILEAIRENEEAVEAAGINPAKYKIFAFAVSALVVGFGGALSVHLNEGVFFNALLSLTTSTEMIVASVIGGMGTILGALWGGLLIRIGEQGMRDLAHGIGVPELEKWATFVFFSLLLVFLFVARLGLFPLIAKLRRGKGV
ncbi:MAG: branched-chain amino acid ABC transporter permease [Candidatus Bipolaricaulota bacterium]|nr:branched-chain amino acid ABC transporter permease [Candidatus Bipolaricaulota bacterium]MCS7274662.1 branched-chain amino acid ABC transporter permease [Candidatus Bipolaricaulota bacterium]MDW8111489.1 branched-chain amino acid ABC transporter permease [Candidatus Bipolaricaulota bacterium]MDW8329623.1 branched-chain amino acid ABC transporter permease [Candidatus Bipolaricaulota bacterium]